MTPPPEITQLAVAFVLAAFGLSGLDLPVRPTVESSGPDGWHLRVWIGTDLGQRVWIARNGRAVALSLDDQHITTALSSLA